MKNKPQKVYVVRKFVLADNVSDAIKKEKKVFADECYLHDTTLNNYLDKLTPKEQPKPMGFETKKI